MQYIQFLDVIRLAGRFVRVALITHETLDAHLKSLAEELRSRDTRAHLVVIGGSALLALGAGTRPTRDVDVVALHAGGEFVTSQPLPPLVAESAAAVAANFDLEPDWLNGAPTSLLTTASGLPAGFAERVQRRRFGSSLVVDFAGRIDLIHFKLYAFADRRAPRDLDDLRVLAPSDDELRDAAAWARTHNAPGPFDDELARALHDLGVGDEGRRPE